VRTHSISPPRVALPNRLLESKPRTFLTAPSGTKRRGKSVPVVAVSALCLLIAGYLVVGYRSLDSYVTSEPVSSAEAYRNEVASILSSDEISPHTQQTLSLLPDATSAVRHSDLVLSLESSERVADADRWVALSELLLEQAEEAQPDEADRARKLYLQSAFYAYRFLFSPEHLSVDQAFDQIPRGFRCS
jgi:hypothetical protein